MSEVITVTIKENPTKDEAIEACIAWFDAETKTLGTFHNRMELCNYSEWACRKVAGQYVEEYKGTPQLVFTTS